MPLDDPAAAAAQAGSAGKPPAAAQQEEEFTLLDIQGSTASPSYRSTANAISAADVPLSDRLSKLAFTGVNVVFSCGTLAVAKQLFNPANFSSAAESATQQQASNALPSWFKQQYKQRRVGQEMTQRVAKDTGVLMAASGLWYGIQFALEKLRGEHDAVNVCIAGTVSAGFLGATFFEPFRLQRVGVWGAVGGLLGYYGYREQQALKQALLERQQELEQKHMHVAPEQVRTVLEPKFFQELLKMEQKQRQAELRTQMHKAGVQIPPGTVLSGKDSGGQQQGQDSSGGGDGQWPGADGSGGSDDQWQKLLNSAPWLQEGGDEGGKQ